MKNTILIISFFLFGITTNAQVKNDSLKLSISLETDPAFWAGTLQNSVGFDANLDFKFKKLQGFRFGILGYSGKWSGAFGKQLILTSDFKEDNWETQWNGLGLEFQYQFKMGLKRGGLLTGVRLQWNQFLYNQNDQKKGEANHFVMTPQIGFQWFPFKKLGLYVLPWAGEQIPALGDDRIYINKTFHATRKLMPIITAHLGWEFSF